MGHCLLHALTAQPRNGTARPTASSGAMQLAWTHGFKVRLCFGDDRPQFFKPCRSSAWVWGARVRPC